MSFDVAVYGGGIGGCVAAVAAARTGASVVLLEPRDSLGGTSTLAWVTPWQSFHHTLCSQETLLYNGIAQELVDILIKSKGCLGHIPDPIGFSPSLTPFEPSVLATILPFWINENNIQVELNFKHKIIPAKSYIDASFSLQLVQNFGYKIKKYSELQPASKIFRIDNVDEATVKQQILENPKNFYRHSDDKIAAGPYLAISGFYSEVKQAQSDGKLDKFRDRILAFGTTVPGELIINTTRVVLEDFNKQSIANETAKLQIKQLVTFLREYLPGFSNCTLVNSAPVLGVRETVHLVGEKTLSTQDVKSGITHSDDIALGAFPIDIHKTDAGLTFHSIGGKGYYGIPLGCTIPKESKNLYVASKCISVEQGAFASTRVTPTVMAVAEAVGKLAAEKAL